MDVAFDEFKDAVNRRKHGISLARAADFALDSSIITVDDRQDYREVRFRAIGFLQGTLHTLIFTEQALTLRAISLRRATRTEAQEFANGH